MQELKQDISSFRYEVLGMLKSKRTSLRDSKSLSGPLKTSHPTCLHQLSIVQQKNINPSMYKPQSFLVNGSVITPSETSCREKARKQFNKCSQKSGQRTKDSAKIYALSEEPGELDDDECVCSLEDGHVNLAKMDKNKEMESECVCEQGEGRVPSESETTEHICSVSETDT